MSESTLETMEMPAENPVLPSVGEQLRTAREGKGLALKEVAQTLKLGVRQLEALEACGMCAAAAQLRDAYRALRRHLHLAKLQEQDGRVAYALVGAEREIVLRWWRQWPCG